MRLPCIAGTDQSTPGFEFPGEEFPQSARNYQYILFWLISELFHLNFP